MSLDIGDLLIFIGLFVTGYALYLFDYRFLILFIGLVFIVLGAFRLKASARANPPIE